MSQRQKHPRALAPIDRGRVEEKLTRIARENFRGRLFDRMEMRYLSGLASNHYLLLADLYDEPTMDRILQKDPGPALDLLYRACEEHLRDGADPAAASIRRIRAVPDGVRLIGEKCLYDVGVFGKRQHGVYDLPELGVASYWRASEILEELARDARLRQFFRDGSAQGSNLEAEIAFLRQCARYFQEYATVLSHLHLFGDEEPSDMAAIPDDDLPSASLRDVDPVDLAGTPPRASLAAAPLEARRQSDQAALEPTPEAVDDPEIARLSPPERLSYYERLLLFSSLDIDRLRDDLRRVVIDQPGAIDTICDDFSLFATGTHARHRPLSYFFIGPTGVGKNHLVEQLTGTMEALWEREVPLLLIEGPSYTYPSDINELRGSTRGFIRSDEEGILTEFHHRASAAPFSVILVDEVEKAHPQLRKFFLSLMDRGTITDNRGQQLNFASSMLVYTSNLGYSRLQQSSDPIGFGGTDARAEFRRRELLSDLKRELSPEFINRVRVVHFDGLSQASIDRIFDLEFERIRQRYSRFHGLSLSVTAAARHELMGRGYSAEYGARHLSRVLHEVCNVEVSKKIRRDTLALEDDDRRGLLNYIQEARREERTPDLDMLRRRVIHRARARVPYRRVVVDHADGRFAYRTS